jgi:dihydrofolate reductase
VFTHRELPIANERIELTSDDVSEVHEHMREAAGDRNRWIVGGGDLAGQFAERGCSTR